MLVQLCNYLHDYSLNCTPLGPVTTCMITFFSFCNLMLKKYLGKPLLGQRFITDKSRCRDFAYFTDYFELDSMINDIIKLLSILNFMLMKRIIFPSFERY